MVFVVLNSAGVGIKIAEWASSWLMVLECFNVNIEGTALQDSTFGILVEVPFCIPGLCIRAKVRITSWIPRSYFLQPTCGF